MASCIYIPTVKVGNKEVESRLFKELTSYINNRDTVKYIYGLTKVSSFMKGVKGIEYDENHEPTLDSLSKALKIDDFIKGKSTLKLEKEELGAINSKGESIKYDSVNDIISKVTEFNKNNNLLVASIGQDQSKYIINIDYKTAKNSDTPSKLVFNNTLNNELRGILSPLGFNSISDSYFSPLNAVTSLENLKEAIDVAKGRTKSSQVSPFLCKFIINSMSSNPLVERIMRLLDNNEVFNNAAQQVYGDNLENSIKSFGTNLKGAKEDIASRILYQYIANKNNILDNELVPRLWTQVSNSLSKITDNQLNEAINNANKGYGEVASQIATDKTYETISLNNILDHEDIYNLADDTNYLKKVADESLRLMSKRLKIMQTRNKRGKYNREDLKVIKQLQENIRKKEYAKSTLDFLSDCINQIDSLNSGIKEVKDSVIDGDPDLGQINTMSRALRNIKEFSQAYVPIIKEMQNLKAMRDEGEVEIMDSDANNIWEQSTKILSTINSITKSYRELRFNTIYKFLKMYWGEDKIIDVGKDKGKRQTLEMIMSLANKDIGFMDRYISSMSDAGDAALSVIDKVVKVSHAHRDQVLNDVAIEIKGLHNKLKKAGYSTDFMYERDETGKPTGRIISNIDFNKFNKERDEYIDTLQSQGTPYYESQAKIEAWERTHMEVVEVNPETGRKEILPMDSLYHKDSLSKLSPAQLEYYKAMMQVKSYTDNMIPESYSNLYLAPQIRNDAVEAVASNITDPKKASKIVLDTIRDKFIRRADDTAFGELVNEDDNTDVKRQMLNFEGNPVEKLPIYYTRKLEDMKRLSTDFTSSILAYTGMAVNYGEMSKVIDALELTRDLINDREVQQMSGNSKIMETFKMFHKVYNKPYTKRGSETNIGNRMNDYFSSVIYGKAKKEEGTVNVLGKEVDLAKASDTFKGYTGVIGLGLNTFSAIANVTVGKMQILIDAIGGEYFNLKDSIIGKKQYWALLPEFLGQLNSNLKTNKLALLANRFDALEEFYNKIEHDKVYQNNLAKIIGKTDWYVLNNLGEHYLHCRNMLSMLNHYKVTDSNGKEISLYNALEVKNIDENGIKVSKIGIKEGTKKLNGEDLTEDDLDKLRLRINKVSQSLNGAFTEEDKGAVHRYALGRLAMQFRQWMPGHFFRRFAGTYYDAQLEQYREGYYRTFGRFIWGLTQDLRKGQFHGATRWTNLSNHEKANLRRSLAETAMFITLLTACSLLGPAVDKKGRWADRMLDYNIRRMYLECGSSFPLSPNMLQNLMQILQSPAPSIKSFNNVANMAEFWNMFNEVQSGRYKGWSKYRRDLYQNIPIIGQISKVANLGNDDSMFTMFRQH